MTKFSMGEFKLPILTSLATLAPVGVAVNYEALVTEVTGAMKIDMTAFAGEASKAVMIPINNALFDLKSRGCIEQSRRGVWCLTQAGADFAAGRIPLPAAAKVAKSGGTAKPASVPAPVAPPAPVAVATPATEPTPAPEPAPVAPTETVDEIADRLAAAEEAPPAPKAKRVKTAKLTVIAEDAPAWVRDNYLRGMVAANTPCFGQYSPSAAACGGCALAPYCRNAQAATLSVLASKLVEATVTPATAKLHTETGNALSPASPRATVTVPPKALRVTYDGVCSRTGTAMVAGDTGYYIPGEGICCLASLTPDERAAVK